MARGSVTVSLLQGHGISNSEPATRAFKIPDQSESSGGEDPQAGQHDHRKEGSSFT